MAMAASQRESSSLPSRASSTRLYKRAPSGELFSPEGSRQRSGPKAAGALSISAQCSGSSVEPTWLDSYDGSKVFPLDSGSRDC